MNRKDTAKDTEKVQVLSMYILCTVYELCTCTVVLVYYQLCTVVRMELLKKRARLFLFLMFSARKKQKKEVPQWKLDIAEGSGAVDDGSDDLPPLPPTPPRAPPTPPEAPSDAAGAAGSAEEAKAEDDDDDDDVDLSKYELGSEEGEEEEAAAEGGESEGALTVAKPEFGVSVTGLAHQTTGDDLKV